MGQQRRRFSPEFKRDAVALHKSSGRSIAAVAKELGIGESNLGGWLAKDREQRAMADPVGTRSRWPSPRRTSVCAAGWRNWRLSARS